ncbi:MAG: MlaD family protein [Acidobacteriota bacterium]
MSLAIKVGLFTAICLVVLGWLIFQVDDLNLFESDGQMVDVVFDSVAGLNEKAPVRVAGVKVGEVEELTLEGRQARARLRLENPIDLGVGARATISNAGILGDKFVELIPGPASAPPLPPNTVLQGETPISFDDALARFDSLGQSLQQLTGEVSRQGDIGQTVRRLLDNLEATSADIRALVATNRGQLDSTIGNFEQFSGTLAAELPELVRQMSELAARIDTLVAENQGNVSESMDNVRQLTAELGTSVDNLNEITGQLRRGEGTMGKLLYDDAAHDQLVDTLASVEGGVEKLGDTIGRISEIELTLGLEGAVYTDLDDENYAAFDLRFQSHPRRYYALGIADGPVNRESTETRTIVTTRPDGGVETTVIEETTLDDDYTFNAQVGYELGDLDLRVGLFESTGGAAVGYSFYDRRVLVSLEAFDFSADDDSDPHLRLSTRFHLNDNIYLLGGYDDLLESDTDSVFFGAGIRWKDDDLKYLLGSLPTGGF